MGERIREGLSIEHRYGWKARFELACKVMVVVTGAAIPLSTALGSTTAGLALLFWLLSGNFLEKFQRAKNNKVIVVSMALFLLMAAAVTYSTVPVDEALRGLRKYLLFLLALVVATVSREEKWRRRGVGAFVFAMVLTLLFSYTDSFGLTNIGEGPVTGYAVFVGQITQNIFMAFTVYLLLHMFVSNKKYRWLIGLVVAFALYNMLFMAMGRTGYLVLAVLLVLFTIQRSVVTRGFNLKRLFFGGILGTAVSAILFTGAYYSSATFKHRVSLASEGISKFQSGDSSSSTGLRMEFYSNGVELILKKPWFGYGMGSLSSEYKKLAEQKGLVGDHVTRNPHNEYIMMAFQLGIVGLAVFLYLLYSQWQASRMMACNEMFRAQGFVVVMLVGSLLNSLLLDHVTGLFFGFFTGLLFAGVKSVSLVDKGDRKSSSKCSIRVGE